LVLTAVLTAAVTALFAELWVGEGLDVVPSRLAQAWKIYVIPYSLLLLFGAVTAPFVYWALHAEIPRYAANIAVYGVVFLGKFAALALGSVSSLAFVRRGEAPGIRAALRLGFRTLKANAGFFAAVLLGVWFFQEACVYLARSLAPGVLSGFFTTAIPLLGCVALPIEAWRSGRLKKA
jgi:hypothetical protein